MTSGLQERLPGVVEEALGSAYEIDGMHPRFAARPTDVEGVSDAMRFAHEQELAVAPWGGGTRIVLGNVPDRYDMALDVTGLDRIVDHTPGDLTATVEAGITIAALQEVLGRHGQFLAVDPPLPDRATLGGTLAVGASGPLKWQFGSIRDTVIGMKVVQADGTVTKSGGQVVKNVSGFDMARLHIGALGTLGVIAEVSLKLTPRPAGEATMLAGFDKSGPCINAALDLFRSGLMPLALAVFDAQAERRMGTRGSGSADSQGEWRLAVRFGGRARTLDRQVKESRAAVGSAGADVLEADDAAPLWRALGDFGWDRATRPMLGFRANVTPSGVAPLIEEIEGIDRTDGLDPAIVAHPAHGTVLASWLGDGRVREPIPGILERMRNPASQSGGHIVVEQAPLIARAGIDVWGSGSGPEQVARGLKNQYDAKGILNPGRFAGGI